MRRALETMVMERQTESKATFPPFAQQLIDRGKLEGLREGKLEGLREGELKGLREGELKGLREALLRLLARAGIMLTEADRARIQACDDPATLDQWIENVLGARTAADVLS
jgi:predicted transposase YdaD